LVGADVVKVANGVVEVCPICDRPIPIAVEAALVPASGRDSAREATVWVSVDVSKVWLHLAAHGLDLRSLACAR
jgi:hypothetical protein